MIDAQRTPPNTYSAEDLARFQGFMLRDGRRGGFCWDEKPRCIGRVGEPFGHRFRPRDPESLKALSTEMVARCQHRLDREGAICGALLYIVVMSFGGDAQLRGKGERCLLVVELTDEHVKRMGQEPMIFLRRMALIDVALPGVLLDVGIRGDRELED